MENAFTIFDVMEKKGYFRSNPNNMNSRGANGLSLYKGPTPYPKMLYHPEGKHRVANSGRAESTPFGPAMMNQQFELMNKIVENEEEEAELLAEGWHLTPREALLAAEKNGNLPKTLEVPPEPPLAKAASDLIAKDATIAEKDAEIERLRKLLASQAETAKDGDEDEDETPVVTPSVASKTAVTVKK